MALGKKLTLYVIVIATAAISIAILFSYKTYSSTMDDHYKSMVQGIGRTTAAQIDGDKIEEYINTYTTEGGSSVENLPDFTPDTYFYELYDFLDITCKNMGVEYMYILSIYDGYSLVLMDTEVPRDELDFGEDYFFPNAEEFAQYTTNVQIPTTISQTEDGWFCSGYEVITNSKNEAVAVVGVDIMMDDVMADRTGFLTALMMWMAFAMIVFACGSVWFIQRKLVYPINSLSLAASQFVSEKESQKREEYESAISKLDIHTGDEIEKLVDSIQMMEKDINRYITSLATITAEKERIGAELNVATRIQASMLPCIFPAFPDRKDFDIYATMTPAKEVGGDFYDFFMIDEDHLAIVMADVSGKGVPAALFMVIAKTLIKNHAQAGESAAEVFMNVNRQLCENNEEELFVTAWMGILTISTGMVTYVNAGHNPPLIRKANGEFSYLKCRAGFVLAGMDGMRYRQAEMQLEQGDMIYLYTDGVTEAANPRKDLYGEPRLLEKLNQLKDLPLEEILHDLKKDIDVFAEGEAQSDDITMLILKMGVVEAESKLGMHS